MSVQAVVSARTPAFMTLLHLMSIQLSTWKTAVSAITATINAHKKQSELPNWQRGDNIKVQAMY
jgi:hypothetical protein